MRTFHHPAKLPLCSSVLFFPPITNFATTDRPAVTIVVPCPECFWHPSLLYTSSLFCKWIGIWVLSNLGLLWIKWLWTFQLFQFITISYDRISQSHATQIRRVPFNLVRSQTQECSWQHMAHPFRCHLLLWASRDITVILDPFCCITHLFIPLPSATVLTSPHWYWFLPKPFHLSKGREVQPRR